MDFQTLPAQQHGHVGSLLACDCQLVLHLQNHILGRPILPMAGTPISGGFALQDLHIRRADYFAIQVAEQERHLGVLQHGVDFADAVARLLRVRSGHNWF
ncbi:hypothetical protein X977_5102 [Burkholderia pseudomallei MSHR7504]|nr:hypothetical protein X977_5102 [Burkholderia pseudomallei MSHR7504]